jgi:hypothetical protein
MRLDLIGHGCEPGGSDLNEIAGLNSWSESERGGDVMSDESPASDGPNPQPAEASRGPSLTTAAPESPTRRTRISGAWVGVIIGVVVLAFLLAFIIQNGQSVKVSLLHRACAHAARRGSAACSSRRCAACRDRGVTAHLAAASPHAPIEMN